MQKYYQNKMEPTYELVTNDKGQKGIKCLTCGLISYNSLDVLKRYCGNCHQFHELAQLMKRSEEIKKLLEKDLAQMEKEMRRWDIIFFFIKTFVTIFITLGFLAPFVAVKLGIILFVDTPQTFWYQILIRGALGGGWGYYMSNGYLIPFLERRRKAQEEKWRKKMEGKN